MFRLLVFLSTVLALAASAALPADPSGGRIVGGKKVDISKHPHQVSIRDKKCPTCAFKHICGGSIISKNIILTAAHCLENAEAKSLHVVAGTSERAGYGMVFPVEKFIYHEDFFKNAPFDNDVAILVLEIDMPIDGHDIRAIELTKTRPVPNEIAQITGWGQVSENGPLSDVLLEVDVPIISNEECESRFEDGRINWSMLCAGYPKGGKDACSGDSGGPMVVNGILVGVVSWGDGCARADVPGVYASVADLRDWIDAAVQANS